MSSDAAVDDLWLAVEARGGGYEAGHPDDPAYVVQATGLGCCCGYGVERAEPGCSLGFFHAHGVADLAGLMQLAFFEGELACCKDEVTCAGGRDVGAGWRGDVGELEPEFAKAGFGVLGH
jgi:hypothetical protein